MLAEDDRAVRESLTRALALEGYDVIAVTNGAQALDGLRENSPDLVLLDVSMPHVDGLTVCRVLRSERNQVPVLMLTARTETSDRVAGLDAGADDYLVKPFDLDELAARLRALLRRSQGRTHPLIEVGPLRVDPAARSASWKGQPVNLSPREFAALSILAENAGRVVAKSRLQADLYGWEQDVESNAVEVWIHHLRRKLDTDLIRTVRGVGYMMVDVQAP